MHESQLLRRRFGDADAQVGEVAGFAGHEFEAERFGRSGGPLRERLEERIGAFLIDAGVAHHGLACGLQVRAPRAGTEHRGSDFAHRQSRILSLLAF